MGVCETCPRSMIAETAKNLDQAAVGKFLASFKNSNPDVQFDDANTIGLRESAFDFLTTNYQCPGSQVVLQEATGNAIIACPMDQLATRAIHVGALNLEKERAEQINSPNTGQYL